MPIPPQTSPFGAGPGFMPQPSMSGGPPMPSIQAQIRVPPPGYSLRPPQQMPPGANAMPMARPAPAAAPSPPAPRTSAPHTSDEEKNAQLLVQVLQLSEEQIALLAPEDRQKVIELRNQLRKTVNT